MDMNNVIALVAAVFGAIGIALGGLLQWAIQKWSRRRDQVQRIREMVTDFSEGIGSYSAVLVQSATMIDKAAMDYKERQKVDPDAELDIDEDYLNRLAEEFFTQYAKSNSLSVRLMGSSDHRIGDQTNVVHLKLAEVQNETGYIHTGTTLISPEQAKKLQTDLIDDVNILLTMVAPSKKEKFREFISAEDAKEQIKNEQKASTTPSS